jgi:photosystem II stability/assembly factor-like uncharacterized protein
MKKIIFTVLIIPFFLTIANAQWTLQNSSGSLLNDVHFINPNTGWVCGLGSTILKTTNGGTNWISQPHPADDRNIMGIHPVDSNVVYCVGYFETILKTTNGGANWILLKSGSFGQSPSFLGVFFVNANTGWIGGQGNYIFKTTNGGVSFDSTYLFALVNDIYFKDAMTGLVCGGADIMFKTTNGGVNWTPTPLPGGTATEIYKMSFVNNQYGWVIGLNNKVFKTTDFGSNWDSIGYVVGASNVQCSFFTDLYTGWAGVVNSPNIKMWKTTNGGYNWIGQTNYPYIALVSSIYFLDNNTGWTVGGGGYIYHTTNGGLSFISETGKSVPDEFKLFQNYPNPFNSQTNFEYQINKNDTYKLEIFNTDGKLVDVIFNKYKQKGEYSVQYNARNLSSGIYFYKLSSPNGSVIKKLVLLK